MSNCRGVAAVVLIALLMIPEMLAGADVVLTEIERGKRIADIAAKTEAYILICKKEQSTRDIPLWDTLEELGFTQDQLSQVRRHFVDVLYGSLDAEAVRKAAQKHSDILTELRASYGVLLGEHCDDDAFELRVRENIDRLERFVADPKSFDISELDSLSKT